MLSSASPAPLHPTRSSADDDPANPARGLRTRVWWERSCRLLNQLTHASRELRPGKAVHLDQLLVRRRVNVVRTSVGAQRVECGDPLHAAVCRTPPRQNLQKVLPDETIVLLCDDDPLPRV